MSDRVDAAQPSHRIQLECHGKVHHGEYRVSDGVVTVVYESRRMVTPIDEMAPDRMAWLLFRCLIAGLKMKPRRLTDRSRPPLLLPKPASLPDQFGVSDVATPPSVFGNAA
jgi:hypothetical protein